MFSTSGHTASYKLGKTILPQLDAGTRGAEVVGMFFFDDNTYLFRRGDPMGERLAKVATDQGTLLMLCDQCTLERGLAEGQPGACTPTGVVDGVRVGCFPDLYAALAGNPPDQVITLWQASAVSRQPSAVSSPCPNLKDPEARCGTLPQPLAAGIEQCGLLADG